MATKTKNKNNLKKTLTPQGGPKNRPFLFSISFKEKIFLAKHLAVMLKAGIPLRDALIALLEQAETPSLRHLLGTCVRDLEGGQVLGHCLEKFSRVFDPFFVNTVVVGEASGTLADSLQYLAIQLEKARELASKVRTALIYPIIVFVGAVGIGTYLSFFLLPKLVPLFVSLGANLPVTTRLLLSFTEFTSAHWIVVLVGLAILIISSFFLWRIHSVRAFFHLLFIQMPIFGRLTRQVQTAKFARILGTLLSAGIKVVPAIRITAGSVNNLAYQKELFIVADLAERGEAITNALKMKRQLFDQTTISMVSVGENTGRLHESLLALAAFTESEVDNDIRNLSSLIEPVILVIVGLLVGFVALAVISPIYQITQTVTR